MKKNGRNDPCPCGSGKKYKQCCMHRDEALAASKGAETALIPELTQTAMEHHQAGRFPEAGAIYRQILQLAPNNLDALHLSGLVAYQAGDNAMAADLIGKAIRIKPNAPMHSNLGLAFQAQGELDMAEANYRKALMLDPNYAKAHYNLGNLLQAQGKLEPAISCYRKALYRNPDHADTYTNLGNALHAQGKYDAAIENYSKAIRLKPDDAEVYNNLGTSFKEQGKLDTAIENYRHAILLKPDCAEAHSNLLFIQNYIAHTPEACLEQARKYGRMVASKVGERFVSWQCRVQPEHLRVGIVSGDLYNHSAGYFLEGMLQNIDPARIELIAYPTQPKEDELTARIKPCFAAWKPLVGKDDEAAARLIHADGVHVLLDLSGHTANNRLPVFAWKPAPVQAMWLGYFATTGVAEMDYVLGDRWLLPEGEEHHFVEQGWRLSGAHSCLTPPKENITVATLPALRNTSITFGTLNNLTKINDRVVACWAGILHQIPNSRLYMNTDGLRDSTVRKTIIERYAAQGIAEHRLILDATRGRAAALQSYNLIDIALDPFPYPGGTSSYEALWMGVPILTMRGNNYLSHLGESIMHHVGLPDWIAANEEDYVAKAVAFAANLTNLAALRSSLRDRVLASPLFDAPRFARDFEAALWGMWHMHSKSQHQNSGHVA